MKRHPLVVWLALFAGLMDLCTGVGLVLLPVTTLALMGLSAPPPAALVLVRYIGVFVGTVGFTYLWALRKPELRLPTILGSTAITRLCIGVFCLVQVARGDLERPWLMVAATDLGLAAAQGWLLLKHKGEFHGKR